MGGSFGEVLTVSMDVNNGNVFLFVFCCYFLFCPLVIKKQLNASLAKRVCTYFCFVQLF